MVGRSPNRCPCPSQRGRDRRPPRIEIHRSTEGGRSVRSVRGPGVGRSPAVQATRLLGRRNRRHQPCLDGAHCVRVLTLGARPPRRRAVRLAGLSLAGLGLAGLRPARLRLRCLGPCRAGVPGSGVVCPRPVAGPGKIATGAGRRRPLLRLPSAIGQVVTRPVDTFGPGAVAAPASWRWAVGRGYPVCRAGVGRIGQAACTTVGRPGAGSSGRHNLSAPAPSRRI
jgi:hypothetical protein